MIRLGKAIIFAAILAAAWSAGFVGLKCYSGGPPDERSMAIERDRAQPPGYRREEASTFLTLPEWYIVYNSDEYARALQSRPPSAFPYIGSVRQYWRYYGAACEATRGVYPFSAGNHLMLAVIGSSFSIEYALKAVYENTAGRLSEWIGGHDTPEDLFARQTAAEYGTFMHTVPWYEFPFAAKIGALWASTPATGPHMFRKWERRGALTAEYGVKAAYGWLIGLSSGAAYGEEDLTVHARIENVSAHALIDGVTKVRAAPDGGAIVAIPRYEAFTGRVLTMLQQGIRFVDIAGNDEILVTVLAPAGWSAGGINASVVLDERLLTDVTLRRVGLALPVAALHTAVPQIQAAGARIEHFYDY